MNTISLEAANEISELTVFGFGFGLVFVGLVCLIAICYIMGSVCKALVKEEPKKVQTPAKTPATTIPNKQELAAAISAVIAEELGTDIKGIRIHSIKKV